MRLRDDGQIPVIYLTTKAADGAALRRAAMSEPFGYLTQPFDDAQLRTAVEIALYKHASERSRRESERRYAVTLSSIGDAVIATDDHARVTFVNPEAEALTGWPAAQALGLPLSEVFRAVSEGALKKVKDPAAQMLLYGSGAWSFDNAALLSRDGREIAVEASCAPIVDDSGVTTARSWFFGT